MNASDITAEELGRLNVHDESGATLPLASLWAEHTAVLVFVRHFG